MVTARQGPYSIDELLAYWQEAVVDPQYALALVEQGDGSGLELFTQQMAQTVRVSEAINRTGQAMFILPWSGQTDEPAAGAAKATVELTITRTKRFDATITFAAGDVFALEIETDVSPTGGIAVETGRRYVIAETVTLAPGETTLTVQAVAEKAGYGYNNPRPGTIKELDQPGAGFSNIDASVLIGVISNRLQVAPPVDVVVPEHVGQYIEFTSGSNQGELRRVIGYEQPDAGVPHGGIADLARTTVARLSSVSGDYTLGEDVTIDDVGSGSGGGSARFLHKSGDDIYLVLEGLSGAIAATDEVTGAASLTLGVVDSVIQAADLIAETGTAGWRVADWKFDLGIEVTNVASPSGGRSPMLDELGAERNIARASGESDEVYRDRVHSLPDVVSPNAIKRKANEVLAPLGYEGCFREVGDIADLYPGFFFDAVSDDPHHHYYYDIGDDPLEIDQFARFKLLVDFEEMRAFFLMGVPPLNLGEFGFGYDEGGTPAYDSFPFLSFYDGYPLTAATIYRSIWQAIDKVRAGGVGFDLYLETRGCF